MAELVLKNGHIVLFDEVDTDFIKQYNWFADKIGNRFYVKARLMNLNGTQRSFYLHRGIMGVTDRNVLVDHINGNPLDNRRCNLRACSSSDNSKNRQKSVGTMFPYKGVEPKGFGYSARIAANGKRFCLGTFDCPIKAAKAYDSAAIFYHGEFANLNFPNPHPSEK